MGTRGACGFIKDGVEKVSYNHFNSYPSGLGAHVIEFVKATPDEELLAIYEKIVMVAENTIPTAEQIAECAAYENLQVSSQSNQDWYCLLREAQGDLKSYRGDLRYMIDSKAFLGDSLFCEWAYIINLDTRKLEVYRGFNHNQTAPGRYTGMDKYESQGGTTYYGVALLNEIGFDEARIIPTDALVEKIKHVADPDENDE